MAIASKFPTIRPSLDLNFAGSKTVDPRITFTRASSATYFDEFGVLRTAANNAPRIDHSPITGECLGLLIEEQRTNLLTYSEQFDNAAWFKSNATVTANVAIAPDGTLTADKLVMASGISPSTTDNVGIQNFNRVNISGATHALSFYAKAAEASSVRIRENISTGAFLTVDLISGAITNGNSSQYVSPTAVSVGNGWWRISFNTATGSASTSKYGLRVNATGDGTSGIYIWGAQLEAGAHPTSYIPTPATFTSRNSTATYFDSTGVMRTAAINEPRYDHGLVNGQWVSKGLVLENSATNLLTWSENTSSDTTLYGLTTTQNSTTAPDGSTSADLLVEDTSSGAHDFVKNVSYNAGTSYTLSYFAKQHSSGSKRWLAFIFPFQAFSDAQYRSAVFDLDTGSYTSIGSGVICNAERVGDYWRCSISVFVDLTVNNVIRIRVHNQASNATSIYTGDGTSGIYVWGAQLEVGTRPTSYIKTEAATITRAVDLSTSNTTTRAADSVVMTGSNFSSWYRQDEGTVFIDYNIREKLAASRALGISDGSTNTLEAISGNGVAGTIGSGGYMYLVSGGVVQASVPGAVANTPNTNYTTAMSYKTNDVDAARNGVAGTKDTNAAIPVMNRMYLGASSSGATHLSGTIRRVAFYPKKLSADQLVALTQ